MCKSRKGVTAGVHMRSRVRQQLGDQIASRWRHRNAEHVVAGSDRNIVPRWAAVDDWNAVGRHRLPAEPFFFDRIGEMDRKFKPKSMPQEDTLTPHWSGTTLR